MWLFCLAVWSETCVDTNNKQPPCMLNMEMVIVEWFLIDHIDWSENINILNLNRFYLYFQIEYILCRAKFKKKIQKWNIKPFIESFIQNFYFKFLNHSFQRKIAFCKQIEQPQWDFQPHIITNRISHFRALVYFILFSFICTATFAYVSI